MGEQKTVLSCEASVDISIVVELHAYLKQALQERQAVEIDASGVERIDASVLQLIYGYLRAANEQGLQVSWSGASDAVYAAAKLLGIEKDLQLPSVA